MDINLISLNNNIIIFKCIELKTVVVTELCIHQFKNNFLRNKDNIMLIYNKIA